MTDPVDEEPEVAGDFTSGEKVKHVNGPTTVPSPAPTVAEALARDLDIHDADDQDRYVREQQLGVGGMGEVYLCEDRVTGRRVAMKVMEAQRAGNPEVRARFLREARVQGQLQHPAIVPVYDLGHDSNGERFFTMKRVTGVSLDAVFDQLAAGNRSVGERFPRNKLVNVFCQLCLAIGYAHSRGVIHRDLKPGNVMIGELGEVYVLDWGLAKVSSENSVVDIADENAARTVQGQILGTPGYMAPEQAVSANEVDERADVYALGAVLFEILTHAPLHSGANSRELLRSTQRGADARASLRYPDRDVPPELEAVCVRATTHDPAERYASVRELYKDVERYIEGDRDVELRRDLSQRHAEAAEEAAIRVLASPERSLHRSRALEHAGRALALDPESRGAQRVLMALLLEPPAEAPAEVSAELENEAAREYRFTAAFGATMYGLFLLGAGALLAVFGKSWLGAALIVLPLAAAVAACANALRPGFAHHDVNTVCVSLLVSLAIGSASSLYGPLVLVPTLVAANAGALNLLVAKPYRPIHFGFSCAALIVPYALEWAGLTPRSYTFADNTITVTSEVIHLSPVMAPVALLMLSMVAIVGTNLMAARWSDALSEVRRRVHIQMWHLEQLAPGRTAPNTYTTP